MFSPKFVSGTWITITNPSCTYDALSDHHRRHHTEHGKWRRGGGGKNKITRAPHLVQEHTCCADRPANQREQTKGREGGREGEALSLQQPRGSLKILPSFDVFLGCLFLLLLLLLLLAFSSSLGSTVRPFQRKARLLACSAFCPPLPTTPHPQR